MKSIDVGIEKNRHIALNYLNTPGFTDTPEENRAFRSLLENHPVQMIQWRNLNIDPALYWNAMSKSRHLGRPMGMRKVLEEIKADFPLIRFGYFNPPRETWTRWSGKTPSGKENRLS
jgi:hypothetical protein